MNKYDLVSLQSAALNEYNDCSVKALALLTNKPYRDAHSICKEYGRVNRRGFELSKQLQILIDMGYNVEQILGKNSVTGHFSLLPVHNIKTWMKLPDVRLKQANKSLYTPRTIGKLCKKGKYLCITRNHAFAVVDGNILDWSENNKIRVLFCFKVSVSET